MMCFGTGDGVGNVGGREEEEARLVGETEDVIGRGSE